MQQPALSTMTLANAADGADLLRRHGRLGNQPLEVDFHMNESQLAAIRYEHKHGAIEVASVHNCVPRLVGTTQRYNTGLANLDETERRQGVKDARYSLDLAAEFGVDKLVMPLGRIEPALEGEERLRRLYTRGQALTPEFEQIRTDLLQERAARIGPHLDAAKRSLDNLAPVAEALGVKICFENRYEFGKLPLPQDLDELRGIYGNIVGSCHDFGHAANLYFLGLSEHDPFCPSSPVDVWHVTDINQATLEDHFPLGHGHLDLKAMARTVRTAPQALTVVEVRYWHALEAVLETISLVRHWLALPAF